MVSDVDTDDDQALVANLAGIFTNLPQRDVVVQEDAQNWLENILKWHKPRAEWHANRLRGIGGSEMGAVVRGMLELKESGFSTMERVAEHKLMKRLPDFETWHMKRGTVLERLAQLSFQYRYDASTDTDSIKKIEQGTSVKGYEWLVGNPDDVVFMSSGRYLVDYKVPNAVDDSVDFDYEVQLNHYRLNAEFKGVKFDGMLLAKLDLAPEIAAALVDRVETMQVSELHELAQTIAKVNLPGMRILPVMVEPNPQLRQQILECGNQFWNDYILKGVVPNQKQDLLPVSDMTAEKISGYQRQYAAAKAGINQLNAIASEAESAIAGLLDGVDFKNAVFSETLVSVKEKPLDKALVINEALLRGATEEDLLADKKSYSVNALLDEIKRLGGDVSGDALYEKASDAKKAEAFLVAKGVPLDDFRQSGVTLRVSTKKADKEAMAELEAHALTVMQPLILSATEDNSFDDFGGDDDDIALFDSDFGVESGSEALSDSFDQDSVLDEKNTQTPRFKGASMR